MKRASSILLLFGAVNLLAGLSMAKDWRGIKPLYSSRADVERLLGQGTNECRCAYYLNDLNVFFLYSSGDCKSGGSGGWDVPNDTVLRILVYPKPNPSLSELFLDLKKFEKKRDPHIEIVVSYVSDDLVVDVDESRNTVMSLSYVPTKADRERRCR